MMSLYQPAHDRQAQPAASLAAAAGRVGPVKALEDQRQVFGRDARPRSMTRQAT